MTMAIFQAAGYAPVLKLKVNNSLLQDASGNPVRTDCLGWNQFLQCYCHRWSPEMNIMNMLICLSPDFGEHTIEEVLVFKAALR